MSHLRIPGLSAGEAKEEFKQQSLTFFTLWLSERNSLDYTQFVFFFGLSEAMQSVIIKDFSESMIQTSLPVLSRCTQSERKE